MNPVSFRHFSFAGLLLCAIVLGGARADDWPRWRGPHLNGVSSEKDWSSTWPADGPPSLWKAQVGIGFSTVAVADGRVFSLGNTNETDTVWALDAASGKPLWRHDYPCPLDAVYYEGGPGSTPSVHGRHVYTLGKRGQLFALEAATGKVIWQKNLMTELNAGKPRWGFAGSPLVEGDRLILNVGGTGTAVETLTGKIVWHSDTNAAGYATPVPVTLDGERCVLLFIRNGLAAVTVKTGQVLWTHPWSTKWDINAADPVVSGDRVFLSSWDGGGAQLQLHGRQAPTVVWSGKNMGNNFNSCVLFDGFLYGIDGHTDAPPKDLRCLDWQTGEVRWREKGFGLGALMVANGRLIVLSDKGELATAAATPNGFTAESRAQILGGKCWSVPVLANGRIYCRNAAGTLVCVDVRQP